MATCRLGFAEKILDCAFDFLVELGRVDLVLLYDMLAKGCGDPPIHSFSETGA